MSSMNLVNAILEGNALQVEESFHAVMAEKISERLDVMRQSMASTMFNYEDVDQIDEKKWIAAAIKHPGALHKQLHVPADKKIPMDKLQAAAEKGGTLAKRANLAMTLRKLGK